MTPRPLGLPDAARTHFNARAEELVLQLVPVYRAPDGPARKAGLALRIPAHTIEVDDGSIIHTLGLVNGLGTEQARGFDAGGEFIGLQGEAMELASRYLLKLWERPECNKTLSETFLRRALFSWLESRFKKVPETLTFLEYLDAEVEKTVRARTIVIPIEFLDLDSGFQLGEVSFDYFREDAFDTIDRSRPLHWPPVTPEMTAFAEDLRKKYQGKAYCSIRLEGEPERCLELAREEIDRALAILRCYSPAAFVPQVPSYFGRAGNAHLPELDCFVFEAATEQPGAAELFTQHISRVDEHRPPHWRIWGDDMARFERAGLFSAGRLLVTPLRSDLQERLLVCFELFARGLCSVRFETRLVFALVALESLLLRNETEPIERNLAMRAAFLTERDLEKRRGVITTMKEAYAARSRFLHHGKATSEDEDFAGHFQHIVWSVLRSVLDRPERTKDELLQAIDDKMLSA